MDNLTPKVEEIKAKIDKKKAKIDVLKKEKVLRDVTD